LGAQILAVLRLCKASRTGRRPDSRCHWFEFSIRASNLSFTVEDSDERLGVPEGVVYWMMIVLRSTETLPLVSASEITDQPRVEVGDPSRRMPEWVHAEVPVNT